MSKKQKKPRSRYLTERNLADIWGKTTKCYIDALFKCFPKELEYFNQTKVTSDKYVRQYLYSLGTNIDVPQVSEAYLEGLLKLSTDDLEFIVKAHHSHKINRSLNTIEVISTELLHRALTQSDDPDTKK